MHRFRATLLLALLAVALPGCGSGDPAPARPPTGTFVQSAPVQPAVVWAVGDGANGSAAARAVARRIAADRPDRVLYLGDVYDNGTPAEFARNFARVYGALAPRMAPTPGNHDWPEHARGYDPYWERVLGRPVAHWYALRAGGWDLVSLNSETAHGAGSPQLRWLRARVRPAGTCRLAFWHRPRWSAGRKHGDQEDTQPLWDALRGRARIVVGGHDHDMQRFRVRDGITQFVSGAGGDDHYPLRRRADLAFGNDRQYGALRLELSPGRARYAFITASGATLDSGSVSCQSG
jgi:calcineurin-like phosphoesterase family protein